MGATFAATESIVANTREKEDYMNGAAGGCAAGFLAGIRGASPRRSAGSELWLTKPSSFGLELQHDHCQSLLLHALSLGQPWVHSMLQAHSLVNAENVNRQKHSKSVGSDFSNKNLHYQMQLRP